MPEFPLKEYYHSKYEIEGLGHSDGALSMPIETLAHRCPEFAQCEIEEAAEVRLHYQLYTYEDAHKICSGGRIIEIDPTTMDWDL